MASKVRVYGKSQVWTALGIVDAYTKMYPHATVEDLNKAFPRKLFTDYHPEENLWDTLETIEQKAKATERQSDDNHIEYVKSHNLYITLSNGDKVTFYNFMWTKDNFPKIVAQAKLYDVEVAEFEKAEKGFGKRGEYKLEYLNGYVPPVPEKKKSNLWIWIIVILALILGLLAWLLLSPKQVVEVEKIVTIVDTVYLQQIEEIEKNFNAAEFVQGKAELSESAKFVLHDLAKVLIQNPQLKLRLEGHTSADGDAAFNQKLSKKRAQAAVDFLVEYENIDATRLEAVGYGSSKLKNETDPTAAENRRTEFIVIE